MFVKTGHVGTKHIISSFILHGDIFILSLIFRIGKQDLEVLL